MAGLYNGNQTRIWLATAVPALLTNIEALPTYCKGPFDFDPHPTINQSGTFHWIDISNGSSNIPQPVTGRNAPNIDPRVYFVCNDGVPISGSPTTVTPSILTVTMNSEGEYIAEANFVLNIVSPKNTGTSGSFGEMFEDFSLFGQFHTEVIKNGLNSSIDIPASNIAGDGTTYFHMENAGYSNDNDTQDNNYSGDLLISYSNVDGNSQANGDKEPLFNDASTLTGLAAPSYSFPITYRKRIKKSADLSGKNIYLGLTLFRAPSLFQSKNGIYGPPPPAPPHPYHRRIYYLIIIFFTLMRIL